MNKKDMNYEAYCYSYPHKTAYRKFTTPKTLEEIWAEESFENLFGYIHIPFCKSKCKFCNLFSIPSTDSEMMDSYISSLKKQVQVYLQFFKHISLGSIAIGGGTPSALSTLNFESLLKLFINDFSVVPGSIPFSVEVSPITTDIEKLELMKWAGVDRVSMGIQSFNENESAILGRIENVDSINRAIANIRNVGFSILNLDLIYGIPGQTLSSWINSLESICKIEPEEIYLYPLYIRKWTAIEKNNKEQHDTRLALYRAGRDYLLNHGYQQLSMRFFRKNSISSIKRTEYCCQEDGMIGLGVGARSYTKSCHYSYPYAVRNKEVKAIINDFVNNKDYAIVDFGIILNEEEQRRRYLIKSILKSEGINRLTYKNRFKKDVLEDFSELYHWAEKKWLDINQEYLCLTDAGIERSDVLGPALFSSDIKDKMKDFRWEKA